MNGEKFRDNMNRVIGIPTAAGFFVSDIIAVIAVPEGRGCTGELIEAGTKASILTMGTAYGFMGGLVAGALYVSATIGPREKAEPQL